MKIRQIHIDGFGVWRNLQLSDLAGRMTVVFGPNEAGKTTLMQFVRSILHGFTKTRRQRYLPPVHGGQPGGSVSIESSHGYYNVARHVNDDGSESLRIVGHDGVVHSHDLLRGLLHDLDEPTFANVFAIGLREMQELATLSDTAAAELLYRLTTGLDRVSLSDVLRELTSSRQWHFDPEGKSSHIAQLLDQRQKLLGEINQLREQTGGYTHLVSERDGIQQELTDSEQRSAELRSTVHRLELALAIYETWHERAAIQRRLDELEPILPVPEGTLERLDVLNARIAERQEKWIQLKAQHKAIEREGRAIAINWTLWRQAPWIEALSTQETWIRDLETTIAEDDVKIATLEQKLRDKLGQLPETDDNRRDLARLQKIKKKLRAPAEAVREARVRLNTAQQAVELGQVSAAKYDESVRTALSSRQSDDLTESLDRAGTLVSQLRRRVQLDERLSKMKQHEAELEHQIRDLLDRQIMPPHLLVGLGSVFVVGMALTMAGLLLPSLGTAGWTLAILGGLGAVAAGIGKLIWERVAAQQLETTQRQLTLLHVQADQAKEERDQLDAQLPRGGGPLVTRLQMAEKDLASLENLVGVDTQRKVAVQDVSSAEGELNAAQEEHRAALRRWQESLRALGLPRKLTPKQVRNYVRQHREVAGTRQSWEDHRLARRQRYDQLQPIAERVERLLADAGLTPRATSPADRLAEMRTALEHQTQRVTQRKGLRAQWRRLGRRMGKVEESLRNCQRQRDELLEAAEAESEAALRERVARAEEAALLHEQAAELTRQMNGVLGVHSHDDDVQTWLEEMDQVRLIAHRDELNRRVHALEGQVRSLHERRGQLNEQLRNLADDRRIPDKMLELGVVGQRLDEAIQRWQVMAVSQRLLETIRHKYERERQPETLQVASQYLARMTDGQYVRVWTPMDNDILRVDDPQGRSLPVDVLSRGTREQLFLALRLALVSTFARRGIHLPLVLDDVLVNFDLRRARLAAEVLRDFAATGHQMLVFTCHEHIVRVFMGLDVPAFALPENHRDGTATRIEFMPLAAEELPMALPVDEPVEPLEIIKHCAAPEPAVAVEARPGRNPDEIILRPVIRRILGPFANAVWQEPVSLDSRDEARRETYDEEPTFDEFELEHFEDEPEDYEPSPPPKKPRRRGDDMEAA